MDNYIFKDEVFAIINIGGRIKDNTLFEKIPLTSVGDVGDKIRSILYIKRGKLRGYLCENYPMHYIKILDDNQNIKY